MLSGKSNAVEREKTAIGLISKKATLHVQHTFFCTFICLCFAPLQRETSGNFLVTRFMEEMSYVFSFTFFHCRSFSPCICGRLHFLFCHRCYKIFLLFFQQKNASFVFFSPPQISVALFFSLSFACLQPTSLFPCISLSLYSKFVDMTINLSLILQTTRTQKQFPLSVFVFIDSLTVSALQDAGGYAISRQNNLELHLGCHTC